MALADWFIGGADYAYHTLLECMNFDHPWVAILAVLCASVSVGYGFIAAEWRKSAKAHLSKDKRAYSASVTLMWIFILCAVCGYGFVLLRIVWPAERLFAIFLVGLNYFTWRYVIANEITYIHKRMGAHIDTHFKPPAWTTLNGGGGAAEAIFSEAVEKSAVPFILYDKDHFIIASNEAMKRLFFGMGSDKDFLTPIAESDGKLIIDVFPPSLANYVIRMNGKMLKEQIPYQWEPWDDTENGAFKCVVFRYLVRPDLVCVQLVPDDVPGRNKAINAMLESNRE